MESRGSGGGGWERCHSRRIEEEVSVVVFSSEGAGAMSRRDTKRGGEIAVGRRKGTDGGVGAGEWEGKRGRKKASRCTWGWFGPGHRPAGSSRSSGCQPLLGSWHCKATGRESREGCWVMGGGSAHPSLLCQGNARARSPEHAMLFYPSNLLNFQKTSAQTATWGLLFVDVDHEAQRG